ncbi:hypothetical protein FRC07_013892, partial [Ceratobasidium sp. 392]
MAQAMLENHRGSSVGATFGADIITLSRTGLQKVSGQKRLDFHTVEEFLLHELEAHIRGLFNKLTGCETSEARAEWAKNHTGNDLYNLASEILVKHASSGALELCEADDKLRPTVIMRQRDLLLYYSLQRAFKHGDIDRVEALLPELLYFFIGSGSHNYAKEVYELLQLLTHETTPAVRAAILQHCLLVNKLGRADTFYPIDQRQELNNKGIRDYGPPPQNSSWEQYGKVSRVIPFYLDMIEHVEGQIAGITRSHKHKDPKHEMDVQALMAQHKKHNIHAHTPGRDIKSTDKAKDAMKAGLLSVRDRNILGDYYEKRQVFFRSSSSLQLSDENDPPSDLPHTLAPQTPDSSHATTPTDLSTGPATPTSPTLGGAALDDSAWEQLAAQ